MSPDYWRIAALDTYSSGDGGSWTLSAEGDDSVGVGPARDAHPRTRSSSSSSDRAARRALAAGRVPSRGDRPARHARGQVVGHDRRRRRRGQPASNYTVASKLPPLSTAQISARAAGTRRRAAAAAPWRAFVRRSRRAPRSTRSRRRRTPASSTTRGADHAVRARPKRCATTSATATLHVRHERRRPRRRAPPSSRSSRQARDSACSSRAPTR